jgi:hypothetical protein
MNAERPVHDSARVSRKVDISRLSRGFRGNYLGMKGLGVRM